MAENFNEEALTAEMTETSQRFLLDRQKISEESLGQWGIQPEDIPAILS